MAAQNREVVVRPRSGLPGFKRNACVAVRDGAIIATNRWGKERQFPIEGSESSPARYGSCFQGGDNLWWLEDRSAEVLLVVDLTGWRSADFLAIEKAANFDYQPLSTRVPAMRSDVFKVMDLPVITWGVACAGIGSAAMALRWLHVLPELVALTVALPALIATILCLLLARLASPGTEERARIADLIDHMDETTAEVLHGEDGAESAPQSEIDGR